MSARPVFVAFAWLVVAVSACGDSSPPRFPPRLSGDFAHPLDATLRMNQLQMLATHNSYHQLTAPPAIPDWNYAFDPLSVQLSSEGVRGLELDVHFVEGVGGAPGSYEVYHLTGLDEGTSCRKFDDCLAEIRLFSDAHPGHHPLFVQIEMKEPAAPDVTDAQLDLLDAQIRAVFPESILVTPDFVRGTHATLRDAVLTDGWPTLAESRGKTMFAFDCARELCIHYAHGGTDLDGRVIFADSDPTDPFAAVMIANTPDASATALVMQGFMVRVFSDSAPDLLAGKPDQLAAALASGAQVISTDVPVPRPEFSYVASIPGGTPSRCNPVNAQTGCVSTDVEDPALLTGRK